MIRRKHLVMALALLGPILGIAGAPAAAQPECAVCVAWNAPQAPFRIYGNTYYVGVHGLSALLIDSGQGLVLIDGGLPQSAPLIEANIKALGFRLEDIKLILNSHAHFDHAGGLRVLQQITHAPVLAGEWSAKVLRAGGMGRDDPQYGVPLLIDPVANVRVVRDGETVRLGSLAFTAHSTPGHTPGGTSWTWMSCEADRCLHMVYADSLNPASAPDYRFGSHPEVLADFEKSFAVVNALPCDVLLTPHPDISGTLEKWQRREAGAATNPFIDANACHAFVVKSRADLAARLAREKSGAVK
jgi:metallo-beta-lactamase class B